MSKHFPQIQTICAGNDFLEVLADQVLQRFPIRDPSRDLSSWTILLPTRRSVRAFIDRLLVRSGNRPMVLPRVRPIGDVDELDVFPATGLQQLPTPLSKTAQLFQLAGLVKDWSTRFPDITLAQDIAQSSIQSLSLAKSLHELLETIEVQDQTLDKLSDACDADFSEHRIAILSLLKFLRIELPRLREAEGVISTTAFRSTFLRLEADRIASGGQRGPIIAAGSTGTIPATRVLLGAIARHPEGAVILPGLDVANAEPVPEEHPQFIMRQFLDELGVAPGEVSILGAQPSARTLLGYEVMRPSASAEKWHTELPRNRDVLAMGAIGLTEIAAPHRHLEARAIALVLRHALEDGTAALVTPDRDLARRVTRELKRWNIGVSDSAGVSLSMTMRGSLLHLLCECVIENFTLTARLAVAYHAESRFDRASINLIDAMIRSLPSIPLQERFSVLLQLAKGNRAANSHSHSNLSDINDSNAQILGGVADALDHAFDQQPRDTVQSFAAQLARLTQAFNNSLADVGYSKAGEAVSDFLVELTENAARYPACTLADACLLVQDMLRRTKHVDEATTHPGLAIYGTLEARLIPTDTLVMGGLNEGVWPAQTDTGPWLNRSLRRILGLPQPERDIGMAAHDFEQGFGHPKLYLTWSKRIEAAPALPARWLLRLKSVLDAAGVENVAKKGDAWVKAALSLHDGGDPATSSKPCFAPPVAARPRRFSVTEVERLIRNPYAVYARKILRLEPVADLSMAATGAHRGSLFHEILAQWNREQAPGLERLKQIGADAFSTLTDGSARFWWPHFLRAARWLGNLETTSKHRLIHSEISGRMDFALNGIDFILTARADRVDELQDGSVSLLDYKTGEAPTPPQVNKGLSPQLTLEAAIALEGGFKEVGQARVASARYIQLSGGRKGLKIIDVAPGQDLENLAREHLEQFKDLMAFYQDPNVAYLPRLCAFKEEDQAEFDHLSRYLEWQLGSGKRHE